MQHIQIDTSRVVRLLYHLLGQVQPRLAEYIGLSDHFANDWGIAPEDHQAYLHLLEQHFHITLQESDRQSLNSIQHTLDFLTRQTQD